MRTLTYLRGLVVSIYLAGGARLAGALVDELDEVVLTIYPVLAGSGVPVLSGAGFAPRELRRTGATSCDTGHQILTFERVHECRGTL